MLNAWGEPLTKQFVQESISQPFARSRRW
jgi:hypothetical protein